MMEVERSDIGTLPATREDLVRRRTAYRNERAMAIDLLYRHSAINQREIGKRLGEIDYSAVSRERTRLRERVKLRPPFGEGAPRDRSDP